MWHRILSDSMQRPVCISVILDVQIKNYWCANPDLLIYESRITDVQIQNYQCVNPELLENAADGMRRLACITVILDVQIQNYLCENLDQYIGN